MNITKETLPNVQAPIRIGSIVMVIDGSYSLSILKDSYELIKNDIGKNNDYWKVIAINVNCPTDNILHLESLTVINNCIIRNMNTLEIAFVSKINIRNTKSLI